MSDERRERALALWQEGADSLLSGDLDEAIDLFTRSLDVEETAEGYTFRGWAYSFQGRLDEAIAECQRAIATDPSFGNPYNDIGCYLVQKGQTVEAVGWFEKAKLAERYEPRHFPHLNLGRLYFSQGQVTEAHAEFEEALRLHPGDPVAAGFLERLRYSIN